MIRSVFRTVELSQGYIGYLATHERYFLGLDTLPLWLGVSSFVWFWPGKYLTPESKVLPDEVVGRDAEGGDGMVMDQMAGETVVGSGNGSIEGKNGRVD